MRNSSEHDFIGTHHFIGAGSGGTNKVTGKNNINKQQFIDWKIVQDVKNRVRREREQIARERLYTLIVTGIIGALCLFAGYALGKLGG